MASTIALNVSDMTRTIAKLADEDFESEWKRYCDSKGGGAVTINLKDMAHHFAQWGAECVKKSQKTLHVAKTCKENGKSLKSCEALEEEIEVFFKDWDKNSYGALFDENGYKVTLDTIRGVVRYFANKASLYRKEEIMMYAAPGYMDSDGENMWARSENFCLLEAKITEGFHIGQKIKLLILPDNNK